MNKIYLIFITLIIISHPGFTLDMEIPYVESLKAAAGESSVILSWEKSDSADYSYKVYRYTDIINNSNFALSDFIGKTTNNSTSFIDYPDTTEFFYYSVLAADSSDNIFKLFIPYNNITTTPVKISSPSSLLKISARITDISASSIGNSIVIKFKSTRDERILSIFRSIKPIFEYEDIADTDFLGEIKSSEMIYTDYPLAGTTNYYAILDSELYLSGRYSVVPGENSTTTGIGVVTGNSEAYLESRESIRNKPLPFLEINTSIESGRQLSTQPTQLPVKQNLSFRTSSIVNTIIDNIFTDKKNILTPVILPYEFETSDNSEEYQLKKIILSDFKEKNWATAYQLLSNFLSVRHSKNTENRAHFYRGQVLFFQNKFRESFMEFILASDMLESEIKPWQDQILIVLRKN